MVGLAGSAETHRSTEVFIILEGESTFSARDEGRRVHAWEIVVVPPNTPHRFFNAGQGKLRQVDIHVSPRFVTEWLR